MIRKKHLLFSYQNFAVVGVKTPTARDATPYKSIAEKGNSMKREFLQNLKVGEETLPKEVIDAIMAENGRDIEAAKTAAGKPYADYETLKEENQRLKEQKTEVDGKTADQWKAAYEQAISDHKGELESIRFQGLLDTAIRASGGRNSKAITAILELDTLRESEDPQAAVNAALEQLRQRESYLFTTPPPYARGTGVRERTEETAPTDLAGALRRKYERK